MPLPRVTEILEDVGLSQSYGFLKPEDRSHYLQRGLALHVALMWDAAGTLDVNSLHPELRPGFQAYRRFVEDTGHIPEASELALEHPFGFQGHLDRVGTCGLVKTAIIDFKFSNAPDLVGAKYQLAAYRLLWDHHEPDRDAEAVFVVALGKDGTYKLHDVTDPYAAEVFKAALVVYRAKQEGKR